jgi:TRAP-type mannitol/chloroaromatic compound transport system permease small subunit
VTGDSRIVSAIDALNRLVGHSVAWLTLGMVVTMSAIVILRYAVGIGPVWLQESVSWMHAAVFMLGGAYTLQRDEHVRVDIFYRGMSQARRALVDTLGIVLFLFPLCGFIAYESYDYVTASWSIHESSRDAGGLPYPSVPLLKTILVVMPILLALQGLSLLIASARRLRGE